ncbi:MAG: helix-turn-helix domain-containing protein [Haloarculaceae archaeon]
MAGNTERDDSGQFESDLRNDEIMCYFADGRPFHTAQEVADRFGIDRSTAYRRLSRLADDGLLEKVSLGSRTVVWWDRRDPTSVPTEGTSKDPLFAAPTFSVDEPVAEDEIDDVLYDEIEK